VTELPAPTQISMHILLTMIPLTLKISYLPEAYDNDIDSVSDACIGDVSHSLCYISGSHHQLPEYLKRRVETDEAIIDYR
jgi:hypothetical protein